MISQGRGKSLRRVGPTKMHRITSTISRPHQTSLPSLHLLHLLLLLSSSISFLAFTVRASYTPLLPPNSLPPSEPDEEPYALIRLNDRMEINISRNDMLAQTRSLTLPGSLPLPEYDVNSEETNDNLPGIDITSAEIVSSGTRNSIGFFFWSSSEENFISPSILVTRPFLPAGRSSSSSTTTITTNDDDDPLSSDDNDADNGDNTDPSDDDPSNQLDSRSIFPSFSSPGSDPASQYSFVPISQSPPFYAAERISFFNYLALEIFVFVEVLPENAIGGGNFATENSDAGPRPSTSRRRRQKVIPEIRTSLFKIKLGISVLRSFGPLGNNGSGYKRFKLPSYARNIRRLAIVSGPPDGSRCEIEVAGKTFAEFEGPGGDARQRARDGRRGRGVGRDIYRPPGERSYLKGPIYGATGLVCYGIFPDGYFDYK